MRDGARFAFVLTCGLVAGMCALFLTPAGGSVASVTAAEAPPPTPIISDDEPAVLAFAAGYSSQIASLSYYPLPLTGKTCRALLVPELTRNAQAATAVTFFTGGGVERIDPDRAMYKSEKYSGPRFHIAAECRPATR